MTASRRTVQRSAALGLGITLLGDGWLCAQPVVSDGDPWAAWHALPAASDYPDPRVRAVSCAILAPNAMNLQPWLVRLVGDDRLQLFVNLSRRLPVSDLPDRHLTVSFGTFTELMVIAASDSGHELDVEPFLTGEPMPRLDARPLVTVQFAPRQGLARAPLLDQVLT
ncbi:MAG: hypothetical protein AB1704_42565 [Pseudomonadota bacterium]|uniref:hypothetical protein n=1 Tax=Paraburkholderia TaxID=1822464 RepID=UPI000694069A|nr:MULTISPECIES: hypothetical protein [Paraburkholderia]PNE56664.1 hypothetical protein A8H39_12905 [Paraburkholderia fungorum]USU14497.1 hypothetical protein NFE55_12720 [Paraburkholderia fungorum]USU22445.1 hypothetical protein NFS19_12720 [Paraburkholderia fungorum]